MELRRVLFRSKAMTTHAAASPDAQTNPGTAPWTRDLGESGSARIDHRQRLSITNRGPMVGADALPVRPRRRLPVLRPQADAPARAHLPGPPREPHAPHGRGGARRGRSEEHTSELQSLMRISYAVFCLKKKQYNILQHPTN